MADISKLEQQGERIHKKISELWGKQIKKECPELANLEGILNHLSLRNRLKNMFAKTKAGDLMGNVSLVDGHIDEPKMTDEKIIKAFEVCYIDRDEDCSECPFCNEDMDCTDIEDNNLLKDVFDLIKRKDAEKDILKAEIERLKEEVLKARRKALLEAFSKFAGHSNYHGDTILCKLKCMAEGKEVKPAIPIDMQVEVSKKIEKEIKSEVIKEFAFDLTEEVKEIYTSNRSEDKDDIIIHVLDIINNLVKEKVEDKVKE